MAKRKSATWPRTISSAGDFGDGGAPVNKSAATRMYISEHPDVDKYSDIVAGVKAQYNYDIKNGDISNAKSFLRKGGSITGIRKVKRKKRGAIAARRAAKAAKIASAKPAAAASSGDVVSATLDLVAAVGLDQARAIIAGLGK